MTTIGKRMRLARINNEKTLEEVAKAVGVSRQTIQRYETGIISNIPSDKIESIAKALNVTPGYLMGWELSPDIPDYPNIFPIETKKIPLLGKIAAGQPVLTEECFDSYVQCGNVINADFCLRVQGDSMINARIYDGDIVFIKHQPEVENGEIAWQPEFDAEAAETIPAAIRMDVEFENGQKVSFLRRTAGNSAVSSYGKFREETYGRR